MLRIGMIGAGWHALADHAPALRWCVDRDAFRGRVELSGVCDLDIEKAKTAAARFGFKCAYDSIETMLTEVDAVLAILPTAAQRAALSSILNRGLPVLVEKPLGSNRAQAEELAAMLAHHPHMVSMNRRFDPAVTIARQWMSHESPPRVATGVMARRNRREPEFIWSTGIHLCDLMCHLVGPANVGDIKFAPASGRMEERVDIQGDGWSLRIHTGTQQPWRVTAWQDDQMVFDRSADERSPDFERNGTVAETSAFLSGVLNDQPMFPTAADVLPGTRIAHVLASRI